MGLKESGLRGSLRSTSSVLPAFFDVTITNTNSPVQEGDILTVDYSADNTGDAQDTQDIRLEIDSVEEDRDSDITLLGAQSTTGTLEWDTPFGDETTYSATVLSDDDSDSVTVEVESAIPDSEDLHVRYSAKELDATDGQTITTFNDLVADNNLTGDAPFRSSGINGNPAVEVDPFDDQGFQTSIDTTIDSSYHIFMAVRYPVANRNSTEGIIGLNSDGITASIRDQESGQVSWRADDGTDISWTEDMDPAIISVGVPSSSSQDTVFRVNGTEVARDSVGVPEWDVVAWGRRWDNDTTEGHLGEFLGYNTDKIGQESDFEEYLSSEWDISLD